MTENVSDKKYNPGKKIGTCKVPTVPSSIRSVFVATLECIDEDGKSMPPYSTATKTPLKAPHWIQ